VVASERVGDVDVLRERVRVYFEDQPPKVFPAAEVRLVSPPGAEPAASAGADPREPAPGDETPPDEAPSE
jgi:hypothetical protein